MSSLHERIAQARKERHLSQANFAERLGVTRTACSHWETGRAKPSTKHIEKIARLLGIDANWLICGIGAKSEPLAKRAEHSSANLVFESRASYPGSFDRETQKVATDYFSLSQGQRKLVRDLIKALHS
jgi:transcriptional regulator with XRE-family HTH domain